MIKILARGIWSVPCLSVVFTSGVPIPHLRLVVSDLRTTQSRRSFVVVVVFRPLGAILSTFSAGYLGFGSVFVHRSTALHMRSMFILSLAPWTFPTTSR